MLCGKASATYGLMHVSYSAGYQATYHKISPPIAPGFGIPAIIIHSVPALGGGEFLLFYKHATATQLFWVPGAGYRLLQGGRLTGKGCKRNCLLGMKNIEDCGKIFCKNFA
jgi:hypothetical protein